MTTPAETPNQPIQNPTLILSAVSRVTGVGPYFVRGSFRQPAIVAARAVAIGVMRQMQMSWPQIGAALGGRSHSSTLELWQTWRRDANTRRDVGIVLADLAAAPARSNPGVPSEPGCGASEPVGSSRVSHPEGASPC